MGNELSSVHFFAEKAASFSTQITLVEQAKSDADAAEKLRTMYRHMAYRYMLDARDRIERSYRRTFELDFAELETAFLMDTAKWQRFIQKYKPEQGKFRVWLYVNIHSRLKSQARREMERENRAQSLDGIDPATDEDSVAEQVAEEEIDAITAVANLRQLWRCALDAVLTPEPAVPLQLNRGQRQAFLALLQAAIQQKLVTPDDTVTRKTLFEDVRKKLDLTPDQVRYRLTGYANNVGDNVRVYPGATDLFIDFFYSQIDAWAGAESAVDGEADARDARFADYAERVRAKSDVLIDELIGWLDTHAEPIGKFLASSAYSGSE